MEERQRERAIDGRVQKGRAKESDSETQIKREREGETERDRETETGTERERGRAMIHWQLRVLLMTISPVFRLT